MTSKRIIALILSTTILSSISVKNPIMAEELSLDSIYSKAYEATTTAMNDKSQKSINDARTAIKMLPKNLDWAIGEFSKQVDKVQQPIFEKAYKAIVEAKKNPAQANIDAAKAAIDKDMPAYYKNSYSSAVDIIQQEKMRHALDLYNKSIKSGLQEDIDKAIKLLEDVAKSTNKSISEWAYLVQAKGNLKDLSDGGNHKENYAILSKTGVFGAEDNSNTTTIEGNIFINNAEGEALTLQNVSIEGTIIINFGSGDVILNNVKATEVRVNNIGSKSLHVAGDSTIENLTVKDTNNDARIVIEEKATIGSAKVLSGAKLEVAQSSTNSKPFGYVIISPTEAANDTNKVILTGNFENVILEKLANVDFTGDSTVKAIEVKKDAEGGKINISKDTKIDTLNISGSVNVTGTGSITNAHIGSDGTKMETKPRNIAVIEGIEAEIAGEIKNKNNSEVIKEIPKGNDAPVYVNPDRGSSGGSSGGGSSNPVPSPKEITITPENFQPEINASGKILNIELNDDVKRSLVIRGNSPKITINAPNASIALNNASAEEIIVKDIANHSLYLNGSTVENLEVQDANNDANIVMMGESSIVSAVINSGATIKSESSAESPLLNLEINNESDAVIDLKGNLGSADINVKKADTVKLEGAVNKITISEEVNNLTVNEKSTINNLEVNTSKSDVLKIVDINGDPTSNLNAILEVVGSLIADSNEELKKYEGRDRTDIIEARKEMVNNFIKEIKPCFGEDREDGEVYASNNSSALEILKKYQDDFLGLNELNLLSEKHQLRYASSFRSILRSMERDNVEFTYDSVQRAIYSTYSITRPIIESSKFKGHFEGETPVIEFNVPEGENDIDITDQVIGFDSDLSSMTTYRILSVSDFVDDGTENNPHFYVKENSNGEPRIFVKPTYNVGTIMTNIMIQVNYMGDTSNTNLAINAIFPYDESAELELVEGYPKFVEGELGTQEYFVYLKATQNATAYVINLPKGSEKPTAKEVRDIEEDKRTYTLEAYKEVLLYYDQGGDNKEYDIYIALEDSTGNLQGEVRHVSAKTPEASESAAEILSIALKDVNDYWYSKDSFNNKIKLYVPKETDITNLQLSITVSTGATVSPSSGQVVDLTNPVTFTVTAEDGTTKEWTVQCIVEDN